MLNRYKDALEDARRAVEIDNTFVKVSYAEVFSVGKGGGDVLVMTNASECSRAVVI